jgi:hypothetical protein
MRSKTVAVGCHRLPIGLFEPFSGRSRLRPVATGAPAGPINAPSIRRESLMAKGFGRPAICASSVEPFFVESGSVGQRQWLVATMNSCPFNF